MAWFKWGKTEEQKLSEEQVKAKKLELEREKRKTREDRACALEHLRIAERYNDSMLTMKGARRSELKAIVDRRIEMAENLGVPLKGTITNTINDLM